jgi:hypothetical protein
MQHVAVTTLNHAAFRVLTILAIGARPPSIDRRSDAGSNGVQAITDTFARKYGISSRDTVYRSLHELLERGLIVRTREGHRNKSHFSLYAVAWLPITHRDGLPLDQSEPAPCGYLDWSPQPMTDRKIGLKLVIPSANRTQSSPIIGQNPTLSRPNLSLLNDDTHPLGGNTLRDLPPQEQEILSRNAEERNRSEADVLPLMERLGL